MNACDQWLINLTLQNWFYFVFLTEFVEWLPTIFPVNIWSTYLFEIKHRWAKWLISDPLSKGTHQWSNDPSLDHEDQWCNESLSRVDLIDHWSENGFAQKDNHRSEILIWILPKERTHTFYILATNSKIIKKLIFTLYNFFQKIMICLSQCICFIYQSSGEQAPKTQCYCSGSVKHMHPSYLLTWFKEKVKKTCELCHKSDIKKKGKPYMLR